MSRIGKQPIEIPSGVTITVDGNAVVVNGSKGSLSQELLPGITLKIEEGVATVERANEEAGTRAKHGLMRSLINNMVVGVSTGFSKQLEINGVGYRVAQAGTNLKFNLGLSHDIMFPIPTGITAAIEQNIVTISGIDKQQVGQVAADIRKLKKPEPYKGKGVKYVGERVLRKSGKSGKEK
jgi:large subunit ribosomal protein L6